VRLNPLRLILRFAGDTTNKTKVADNGQVTALSAQHQERLTALRLRAEHRDRLEHAIIELLCRIRRCSAALFVHIQVNHDAWLTWCTLRRRVWTLRRRLYALREEEAHDIEEAQIWAEV
jgi:hypothetical protein